MAPRARRKRKVIGLQRRKRKRVQRGKERKGTGNCIKDTNSLVFLFLIITGWKRMPLNREKRGPLWKGKENGGKAAFFIICCCVIS